MFVTTVDISIFTCIIYIMYVEYGLQKPCFLIINEAITMYTYTLKIIDKKYLKNSWAFLSDVVIWI